MSDIIATIQDVIDEGENYLELCGMEITNRKLQLASRTWVYCETITNVELAGNRITTLKDVNFPPYVTELSLARNCIDTLDGFVIPDGLEYLELVSLISISKLTTYSLSNNQIATLDGFVVHDRLRTLSSVFSIFHIKTDNWHVDCVIMKSRNLMDSQLRMASNISSWFLYLYICIKLTIYIDCITI